MVYMNLEGNWSLGTPLTGLGCACSYCENFSAKFTICLKPKDYWAIYFKKLITCVIYTFKYLLAATIF